MSDSPNNPAVPLPDELRAFVDREPWIFAKTFAETWPHEYLVRKKAGSEQLFLQLVEHIRTHGYEADFYTSKNIYFDEDGLTYWTMGAPVSKTTIINRCPKESTFEERKKARTLPV